jgi:hypothetical protein
LWSPVRGSKLAPVDRDLEAEQLGGGGGGHPADGVRGGQQGQPGGGEQPFAAGPSPRRRELQAHDRSSRPDGPQAGRSACEVLRQRERRL